METYRFNPLARTQDGGKYSGTKTWPSAGTWTISYEAPVTLYVWVMKHHYNAGVDAALSGDGWEQVDAGDFKRSDNHVLNVWKRSFSSGSQYQIKTTGLMVGGVVSNGCQARALRSLGEMQHRCVSGQDFQSVGCCLPGTVI